MFQKLKVMLLRWIYRYQNYAAWKGHYRPDECQDLHLAGNDFNLRLFANTSGAELPLIVYFHGGGWVIGDVRSHAPFCQQLSDASGCSVVSVDYRLAPEFPFPAAHDDCLAATQWCKAHTTKLGPNNGGLVLAGDSAGANLAAVTALALTDSYGPGVLGQVLIYPVVDHYSGGYSSYQTYATGHGLTRSLMQWFWDLYLGGLSAADSRAQRAMPQLTEEPGDMPPTFVCTAEFDPLQDEGKIFAQRLVAAGVPVTSRHFEQCAHGFACSEGPTVHFTDFMQSLTQWLSMLPQHHKEITSNARPN